MALLAELLIAWNRNSESGFFKLLSFPHPHVLASSLNPGKT